DGGGEVAPGDVDQNALAELDLLQVIAVGAQRLLGIGAAIGIVEERLRDAAPVQLAQILDAGDMLHERSLVPTFRSSRSIAAPTFRELRKVMGTSNLVFASASDLMSLA